MGTGATNKSHALTVVGPRSSSRANPTYVGWPTAGFFPKPMEPAARWSLSAGNAAMSFASARVSVHRIVNGRSVRMPVRQHRVVRGYARPTLVWQIGAARPAGTYKVTVTNIRKAGTAKRYTHSYRVYLFTPSS